MDRVVMVVVNYRMRCLVASPGVGMGVSDWRSGVYAGACGGFTTRMQIAGTERDRSDAVGE